MTGELLTAQEVAAWLRVTPGWVKEMARDGEMPAMKLGRYWRFDRDAVNAWLVECQQRVHIRRT